MYLLEIGFVQSTADPCLYILNAGEVILLVYVDDILFTGTDEDQVSTTIEQLKERFDTVDLGDARFLLGMAIQRNVDAGTILLTQEAYAKAVLDKFGMADARPAKTPAEPGPICIEEEEILSPEDTKFFRSATGSLLYLSRGTRPDITHSVMVLAKSMSKPGPRAITKLKRVLRYLKGQFQSESPTMKMPATEINSRHTLTQTTQVTRTRDTRLLKLFAISQVAQWTGGLQSKRWWPSQR